MSLPPIIERELLVARRKRRVLQTRWWTAVGGALITVLGLLVSRNSAEAGRHLFEFLLFIGGYVAVIQTPKETADLFSLERRNNTLGLLFLAGLSALEVFVSKLLAGALVVLNNLLALFPFFSIPFLLGGVSFSQFLGVVCFLPNLLLFALSISVLASVMCEDESASLLLTAGLGVAIGLGLPAVWVRSPIENLGSNPAVSLGTI